jgi:ribose transport system permease protein
VSGEESGSKHRKFNAGWLQEWGIYVAFAAFVLYCLLFGGALFHDPTTWRNLFTQNADKGLIALGMTLIIIAGGIDLSLGSLLAFVGALGMLTMNHLAGTGMPPDQAALIGIGGMVALGGVFGAVNGLIVTWGRVTPFIATLVGLLVYRSLTLSAAKGGTVTTTPEAGDFLAKLATSGPELPFFQGRNGQPIEFSYSAILFIVVALILGYILNYTAFGRHMIAAGSNERAATYSALPVGRIRFWTYVIGGLCAGLGSWVATSRLTSVGANTTGQNYELEAIAAVVIGGTLLSGGKGRILGTVIGVLFLGLITNVMLAAEIDNFLQGALKGLIILIAVLIQRSSNRR